MRKNWNVEKAPENSRACLERAISAYEDNNFEVCVDFCDRALEHDPQNARAYYYLGLSLYILDDHDGAIDALQNSYWEDYTPALEMMAYLLLRDAGEDENKLSKAQDAYETLLIHYPQHVQALIALATIREALGETTAALKYLKFVLELDPHNTSVHAHYAKLRMDSGDFGQEVENLLRCAWLDNPDLHEAGHYLSRLFALNGNLPYARAVANMLADIGGTKEGTERVQVQAMVASLETFIHSQAACSVESNSLRI